MLLDFQQWNQLNEKAGPNGGYLAVDLNKFVAGSSLTEEKLIEFVKQTFLPFKENCRITKIVPILKKSSESTLVYTINITIELRENEEFDIFSATESVLPKTIKISVITNYEVRNRPNTFTSYIARGLDQWKKRIYTSSKTFFLLEKSDLGKSESELMNEFLNSNFLLDAVQQSVVTYFTSVYNYKKIDTNLTGEKIEKFLFKQKDDREEAEELGISFSYLLAVQIAKSTSDFAQKILVFFDEYSQQIKDKLDQLNEQVTAISKSTKDSSEIVKCIMNMIHLQYRLTIESEFRFPQQKLAVDFLIQLHEIIEKSGFSDQLIERVYLENKESFKWYY